MGASGDRRGDERCVSVLFPYLYSEHHLVGSPLPLLRLCEPPLPACRLSRQLRVIPAAQSESRALYGLDPLSLAQVSSRPGDSERPHKKQRSVPPVSSLRCMGVPKCWHCPVIHP